VKKELRRAGVRVLSVTQEFAEDPMGMLMEGFFECIDQYESEVNDVRTAAAMREAVRQASTQAGSRRTASASCPSRCALEGSRDTSSPSSPLHASAHCRTPERRRAFVHRRPLRAPR
jgi:hypothetical protein